MNVLKGLLIPAVLLMQACSGGMTENLPVEYSRIIQSVSRRGGIIGGKGLDGRVEEQCYTPL